MTGLGAAKGSADRRPAAATTGGTPPADGTEPAVATGGATPPTLVAVVRDLGLAYCSEPSEDTTRRHLERMLAAAADPPAVTGSAGSRC